MRPWNVPRLWPGKTVYIIGGGPSLTEMDLSPIHSQRVIGVNDAFKLGDWVDICWFGDCRWYDWNKDQLREFTGLIASCTICNCKHPKVLRVKRAEGFGISTNPDRIRWNGNSGASAVNLAYLLGAKKVVLLGFDMKQTDGKNNWHNNHKHVPSPLAYDGYIRSFVEIAERAKTLGLEIVNATPNSALTMFKRETLCQSTIVQP